MPLNGKETDRGKLWRTDDGGDNWRVVVTIVHSAAARITTSTWPSPLTMKTKPITDSRFRRLPMAVKLCEVAGARATVRVATTMTCGSTRPTRTAWPWLMMVCIDIGYTRQNLDRITPIAQMYHVTVDNRVPYFVYGNEQDDPSYRGPSNTRGGGFGGGAGQIPRSAWQPVGGGESGWATPDPVDNNIIWSSASGSAASVALLSAST